MSLDTTATAAVFGLGVVAPTTMLVAKSGISPGSKIATVALSAGTGMLIGLIAGAQASHSTTESSAISATTGALIGGGLVTGISLLTSSLESRAPSVNTIALGVLGAVVGAAIGMTVNGISRGSNK